MTQEGVIQYQLNFERKPLPAGLGLSALNACRSRLYARGLLGQDANRYGGLGFGNISQRWPQPANPDAFVVTGSQTGHLQVLEAEHYALVTACDPQQNRLQAQGQTPPSSEAMTHAVVYQSLPAVQAVIHVHWPQLWQNACQQGLAVTAASIAYGTPEMATAVRDKVRDSAGQSCGVLAMLGHEDGILAWGATLEAAETALYACVGHH